jgi:hypothetical protein
MSRRSSRTTLRAGSIAIAALLALPAMLMLLVVGLSSRQFNDIHIRMQNEADAAALAGADALAGDALLRGRYLSGSNSNELYSLLQSSQTIINYYAQVNPVYGGYSTPTWDPANPTQGDIIFGAYDRTLATPFAPVTIVDGMGDPEPGLQAINSVRVFMRRTQATNNPIIIPSMPFVGTGLIDSTTVSTAMLDGDLQGFMPLFPTVAIPLVPCALDYATVTNQTTPPYTDNLTYDPTTQTFVAGQDSLPELTLTLTTPTPPVGVSATAALLNIGVTASADVQTQIVGGIQPAQLAGAPFDGAFLLQPNTSVSPAQLQLAVPGQQYFASSDGPNLAAAFNQIAQTPFTGRLWPIFNGFDNSGQPIVIAFIAARLASVQTETDLMGNVQAITLTLQPTLVTAPSAVTNSAYRGYVGVPNLTIAKLRLVP